MSDTLFNHALAIAGWPLKPIGWLKRQILLRKGAPVTVVEWRGCMGTIRHECGHGKVVKFCNQRELLPNSDPIDLVVVRMEDGKEERFSIQWMRVIEGKRLEIWI